MTTNKPIPKSARPETMSQAVTWQRAKRRYVAAGVCDVCAAQAAWGHQCGFSSIKPPCPVCAGLVATFPTRAVGPWRKLLHQAPSTCVTAELAL